MLHFHTMLFAHRAATLASLNARAQLRARQLKIRASEPGNDPRSSKTYIRAIVAIADALNHPGHIFLADAGIDAGVASFRTCVARSDALNIDRVIR